MKNKSVLLIALSFLIFSSCKDKNNCEAVIEGERFSINESTKVYTSNYFNAQKVIFEDLVSGSEVTFQINMAIDTTSEYQLEAECPDDPNLSSPLKGKSELKIIELENRSNGLFISIEHQAALALFSDSTSEQIFIVEGQFNELFQIQSANSGLLVLTPTSDIPLFTEKRDTLNIGNKEFYDVYEINTANTGYSDSFLNQNLSIKYSKRDGIIYIKDELQNTELVFDRIE